MNRDRTPTARVWLRKEDTPAPFELSGAMVVVVDVLRASTTVATALANGAAGIHPVSTPERALLRAAGISPPPLLAGERGVVLIPGFDLDNSPASFTPERVRGREIVFTTTNGTDALLRCNGAVGVCMGALVNRGAVARVVASRGLPVHIVCCGTGGEVSLDDVIGAGAILESLAALGCAQEGDAAELAAQAWARARADAGGIGAALAASAGGRNLVAAGMQADIALCAAVDTLSVVPEFTLS